MIVTRDATGNVVKVESRSTRARRITQAVRRYARQHGMSTSNVRTVSVHFHAALREAGIQ